MEWSSYGYDKIVEASARHVGKALFGCFDNWKTSPCCTGKIFYEAISKSSKSLFILLARLRLTGDVPRSNYQEYRASAEHIDE